jgi:2,5-diketo-D-gluconate reductase B
MTAAHLPDLPDLGIGTYDLDHDACTASVEHALNVGYRHVDTAEMYDNEAAVGDAIAAADVDREDVFVATKIHSRNLAYEDVLAHARASRDRLGVDVIDLLYVHWPIRAYDPADTLAAFDDLSDQGLIRHVGLSNCTPELLEEARSHLDATVFAHEVECHPLLPQDELRAYAREHDHHLVAYSPLAKGAVTDVPELVDVADKHDATPAQVSLAWLLSKDNVAVIPQSTSPAHIRENFEARHLSLGPEDVERIDAIDRTQRQVDFDGAPWH